MRLLLSLLSFSLAASCLSANTGSDWPANWSAPVAGASWETDTDTNNHFLRLASPRPGTTVTLAHTLPVPDGAELVEIRWRQRITQLVLGPSPGRYAKIDMAFLDATGTPLPSALSVPAYSRNSSGWETKTTRFTVPPGARSLKFAPALIRVEAGTYDLADISIAPAIDTPAAPATPPPVVIAAPRIAPPRPATPPPVSATPPLVSTTGPLPGPNGPPEIRVQGNRLVTVKGGKEVWLQGVNVPSLEWSVKGERILKGIGIAIDDWKANVIRLPVKADYWFGRGTKHNTQTDGGAAYRTLIDQAVALAASKGAYLVLDLHHYRAPRADDLVFWTDAATRYKNHPAVLFDLLNEPHSTTWEVWRDGGFIEEKKKAGDEDAFLSPEEKLHNKRGFVSPGMQKMLDTVRATGAKNIVVVGGLDYAYDLTGIAPYPAVNGRPGSSTGYPLTDKSGNGIMYASHVYPWKKGWQKKFLDAAAKHPILLGEVGGDAKKMTFIPANHQENVETWVPAMLGLIQKHRLNWTGWCFHPSASPRMLADLNYTPTSFWGQPAKDALAGKKFPEPDKLR
jgi:hypothetical protein